MSSNNLFAIGILTPDMTSGLSPYGPTDPHTADVLQFALTGVYGTTASVLWYNDIRDPNTLDFQAAQPTAVNPLGAPLITSYTRMVWGYTKLRPEEWYYLQSLFRQSRKGSNRQVRVRWPQPDGIAETSAVWEQLSTSTRLPNTFTNIQLTFSQLGRTDGFAPALVWLPSAAPSSQTSEYPLVLPDPPQPPSVVGG